MLESIFNALGYVRKPTPDTAAPLPAVPPEAGIEPAAHRKDADQFDWSRVQGNFTSWGCGYSDEDMYHYALGKDGWAPLYVAIAHLFWEPMGFISEELDRKWYLRRGDERFNTWKDANGRALQAFATEMEQKTYALNNGNDFTAIAPSELSHLFEFLYLVSNPRLSAIQLSSSEAAVAFYGLPSMTGLRKARLDSMTDFTAHAIRWLEARGVKVDPVDNLVKIDGYEALYFVEEQLL